MEALHANMDILISGLDVLSCFWIKGNLTDYTVWNTGEAGDMHTTSDLKSNKITFFGEQINTSKMACQTNPINFAI